MLMEENILLFINQLLDRERLSLEWFKTKRNNQQTRQHKN